MVDRHGRDFRESLGLIAVQALRSRDPEPVLLVEDTGCRESIQVAHHWPEDVLFRIVTEDGSGIVCQEHALAGLHHRSDILVVIQDGNPLEASLRGPDRDAVDSGCPEPSVTALEDGIYLIVRQSCCVVGTEVLVIVVDAVFVEAAEGGDPYLAVRILGESIDTLVGYPV